MKLESPPYILELARQFRANPTPAEKALWQHLRTKRLDGWKFYRQYPLYRYIADFYCEKARLVVELDGGAHDRKRQMEYDGERDRYLSVCGIRTLRFSNERALQATGDVLAEIRRQCEMAQIVKLTSDTATQKM